MKTSEDLVLGLGGPEQQRHGTFNENGAFRDSLDKTQQQQQSSKNKHVLTFFLITFLSTLTNQSFLYKTCFGQSIKLEI